MLVKTLLLTVLILVAFGWLASGTPWRGDQALYAQYAERMSHGGVLYKNLWDVANPGVFWFYQAGGLLFGFHEDGIHLFEWFWFAGFVLAVQRLTKTESLSLPLLIGGWYYCTATADPSHLTKVEGLVAVPLVLSILLIHRDSKRAWFAAGLCGGAVLLFKFAFVLLLMAGWLPALWQSRRMPVRWLGLATGVIITVGTAAVYFRLTESWDPMTTALLITPREILAVAEPAGLSRLMLSVRWFVETSTPLIVLAVAGLLAMPGWWRDSRLLGLVFVLPATAVVILIQRWSWWTYHFQLVSLPLAVLAALTWPNLSMRFPEHRWRCLLPLLFLPVLLHGGSSALRLLQHKLGWSGDDRAAARLSAGNAYRIVHEQCNGVPFVPGDTLFVAGDPLFFRVAPCRATIPMHGWSMELFTPALWRQLQDQLQADPPRWIYVDRTEYREETLLITQAPALHSWIQSTYQVHRDTGRGVWYVRR